MQLLFNNAPPSEWRSDSPQDLEPYILRRAEAGELDRHLFLVPTTRLLRKLERSLTDEHVRRTDRPLAHLPLFTIRSFATALYDRLAPGRREVTSEMQIALIERAMNNVDLNYYSRDGKTPSLGVVEQITNVISGVRADGVLPDQFRVDAEAARDFPDIYPNHDVVKLQDLYNIYSEYVRLLGSTWVDYPGRMLRVNTELFKDADRVFREAFPDVRTILIHGYSEFTQPEADMLIQLARVTDLDVFIAFDYERENGPLYGNFEEAIGKLTAGGYGQLVLDPLDPDVPEEERSPFAHHIRHNLFRTDKRIENAEHDERISVYSFHSRDEEVRGVASLIKSIVSAENGPATEDICVATLDMSRYTELFREHFPAHGIPANITGRFSLERNGLITALFSALNILAGSYDRRDVIRAVTSPYLEFGPDVDAAALADVAVKLRITRGYQAWKRRIGRRLDMLSTRLNTMLDADDRRSIELEAETLRRAEESIESVHRTLSDFSTRLTPKEFRESFLRLIARLRGTENVLQLRTALGERKRTPSDWLRVHDEMERDTRALARFIGLLDELTELFEQDAAAEAAKAKAEREAESASDSETPTLFDQTTDDTDERAGTHRLEYYLDHVRTAAARSFYTIREKHAYGVLVTTLDQIQGLDFHTVIICGMVDGEFPSNYLPANFLGKPLEKTEERQLRRERIAFYTGLRSFRNHIVLTHPRLESDREQVRSSFIDALIRITTVEQTGRVVDFRELRVEREERRRAGFSSADQMTFPVRIETLEDLAEEAGRVLWSAGELPNFSTASDMLDHLRHTVHVEVGRRDAAEQSDLVPEYRGIIGGELDQSEREELAERRDQEYSASQLELYARCPFKYFTRRLLSVETPARYDVTLTPLERGFLIHSVLFRLYTELREAGELPISEENRADVLKRAREIAHDEIADITLDHPYWTIDRERLLGSDALNGLLEQWIDTEIDRSGEKTELVPEFFEVAFGKSVSSASSTDSLISRQREFELFDIKVRGKIDRVEVLRKGDEVYYAVADYKTGQPPSRSDIESGLSLQLILYLEVIRHILAEYFGLPPEQVKPAGGIYYRLNARDVDTEDTYLLVPNELKGDLIRQRKYKRDPDTVEVLEERMREAFGIAESYIEGISSGKYHVTTRDINHVCRGCEYHSVCRVWEVGRPEAE